MTDYQKRAHERAVAIRQYRMLSTLEKKACTRRLYNLAAKYRIERLQLKAAYNL